MMDTRMGWVGIFVAVALTLQVPSPGAAAEQAPPATKTEAVSPASDRKADQKQPVEESKAKAIAERHTVLQRLASMDDKALKAALESHRSSEPFLEFYSPFVGDPSYAPLDDCFNEILRRGGPQWAAYIEDRIREAMTPPPEGFKDWTSRGSPLKLLTVLRRLQRSPDPLAVKVPNPPTTCTLPEMPEFDVRLENTDILKLPIRLFLGGDDRSGRRTRFSMEVTDPDGRILPILPRWGADGGIGHFTVLNQGGSEVGYRKMLITKYVEIRKPGRHTIRVLFSDAHIADLASTEGVIVYRSDPFVVDFQLPPIQRTLDTDKAVRELLLKLPEDGPILILGGRYGPQAYKAIPPETPVGRILALGWQAVPEMVDEVSDPLITPVKRAWLLGLLFSVTERNYPTNLCIFSPDTSALKCKFWKTTSDWISEAYSQYQMQNDDDLKALAARWAEWKPLLKQAAAPR